MKRTRSFVLSILAILVLAVGGMAWTVTSGRSPQLGLDLQGGASVVLKPKTRTTAAALRQTRAIIRSRVDGLGVAEPEIVIQGDTIVVELPGVKDQQRALAAVGVTAQLLFRPVLAGPQVVEPQLEAAGIKLKLPTTTTTAEKSSKKTTTTAKKSTKKTTTTTADEADEADETTTTGDVESKASSAVLFGQTDETPPTTAAPTTVVSTPDPAAPPVVPEGVTLPDAAASPFGNCDIASVFAKENLTADGTTRSPKKDQCAVLAQRADEKITGEVTGHYLVGPAEADGRIVKTADPEFDSQANGWVISAKFTGKGSTEFDRIAGLCYIPQGTGQGKPECPTGQLAIALDNQILSAPTIQTDSFQGRAQISGNFTRESSGSLATILRYGALPVELTPQTVQTVSATLGRDSLSAGVVAGLVGLGMVALFIFAYYRLLGLVMLFSLVISAALMWVVISFLGVSLTLSGVCGLIVSIGIAADSGVVYFERLKEDVHTGRTIRTSVERSFKSAYSTTIKADSVSLIGAAVLWYLSVGSVRGFALFLGLSAVLDLFTTYMFTRPVVVMMGQGRLGKRPGLFGIPETERMRAVAPSARAAATNPA